MFRGSRKKTRKSSTSSARKTSSKRTASGRTSTRKTGTTKSTRTSKSTRSTKKSRSTSPARMRINGSLTGSSRRKTTTSSTSKPTPKASTRKTTTTTPKRSTNASASSNKRVSSRSKPAKRRISNQLSRKINRQEFYQKYRKSFVNKLTQDQVDGFEAMLNYFETKKLKDKRYLAYCLATAYHETGATMQPVREGFCKTDTGSIRAVGKLFRKKVISRNYAKKHANGKSYFGRGYIQITHGTNYKRVGQAIGLGNDLYNNPSLALKTDIAVKILFTGMLRGLFTGRKLKKYFNRTGTDWVNARRIVNGTDRAALIANYAVRFRTCLEGGA